MFVLQTISQEQRSELIKKTTVCLCLGMNLLLGSLIYAQIHETQYRYVFIPVLLLVAHIMAIRSGERLSALLLEPDM